MARRVGLSQRSGDWRHAVRGKPARAAGGGSPQPLVTPRGWVRQGPWRVGRERSSQRRNSRFFQ